jgi:hypothetical protein
MTAFHPVARCTGLGIVSMLLATSALAAGYSTPIRDVENPPRTFFQASGTLTMPANFVGVGGQTLADVPENKRLVIEEVSVSCFTPIGSSILTAAVNTVFATSPSSFVTRRFEIPMTFKGTDAFNGPVYVGRISTRLYADHPFIGSGVTTSATRDHGVGEAECFFSLSGYTIDL